MPMNTSQARVIDPILTQHARGYGNPDVERAGAILFPRAPVNQRGAKIIKFGREHFRLYNTARAPGAAKKRVQIGYSDESISMVQHALSGTVPFEVLDEANRVPNVDLARRSVNVPMESIARELEYRQAQIAQNAANYGANNKETLAGTDQWDDYATSDPGEQMDDAHSAIRSKIGRRGNTLVLGPQVYRKIRRHPKVLGHFYSGVKNGPAVVSREQIAAYFDVARVAIGEDIYLPADAADDADFSDVWSDVAILAYVPSGEGQIDVPSYGYTYFLKGHPIVEAPYQDRDHDVWVYPTKDEHAPVLTGMEAGYLFSDVLSSV